MVKYYSSHKPKRSPHEVSPEAQFEEDENGQKTQHVHENGKKVVVGESEEPAEYSPPPVLSFPNFYKDLE